MAGGLEVSSDLREWASDARYSLTPSDQYGRAVFSTSNSEIRYFIGAGNDGRFRVTRSNRMGPEQLELAAPSLLTIETFLYGSFGSDIRYYSDLAQAKLAEPLPDGFRVGSLADEGQDHLARFVAANRDYLAQLGEPDQDYVARYSDTNRDYLVLIAPDGDRTAVDCSGRFLAEIRLTRLAVYLRYGVEEIKASFLNPSGGQLLTVSDGEGEGTAAPS
ncbi:MULTISPECIES: Imm61 family immunity protein [unclassified Mycobacterium]|uniref:Imm61 family immunity protein n=1 Tax=unclassified Mycobacterium TaxID=2642494 RepID=UPI000B0ED042|nr:MULTISPECIES: Imm61 family immunity protein [unclassified Mycobacterium]